MGYHIAFLLYSDTQAWVDLTERWQRVRTERNWYPWYTHKHTHTYTHTHTFINRTYTLSTPAFWCYVEHAFCLLLCFCCQIGFGAVRAEHSLFNQQLNICARLSVWLTVLLINEWSLVSVKKEKKPWCIKLLLPCYSACYISPRGSISVVGLHFKSSNYTLFRSIYISLCLAISRGLVGYQWNMWGCTSKRIGKPTDSTICLCAWVFVGLSVCHSQ